MFMAMKFKWCPCSNLFGPVMDRYHEHSKSKHSTEIQIQKNTSTSMPPTQICRSRLPE